MRHLSTRIFAILALAILGTAHAAPVPGQGTWETTLLGRDINGNPVSINDPNAEFAYDTVLDATWYLTENHAQLTWSEAMNWAAGLTVGKFSGWVLPGTDTSCFLYNCTKSQMGELYYKALGNSAAVLLSNTGPFKNLQPLIDWSATEDAAEPQDAWSFGFGHGVQGTFHKEVSRINSLAIRTGDILVAVPEPETYAMLLAGLGLLGATVRRRDHSANSATA